MFVDEHPTIERSPTADKWNGKPDLEVLGQSFIPWLPLLFLVLDGLAFTGFLTDWCMMMFAIANPLW